MKRGPARSKRNATILVAILLAAGLVPIVVSTHVNDLIHLPGPGEPPATGIGPVDNALGTAYDAAQAGIDEANQLLAPLREEPQVPATFFHDTFAFDSEGDAVRIGGWGDWLPSSSQQWHLGPPGAGRTTDRNFGSPWNAFGDTLERPPGDHDYAFRDAGTGFYPVLTSGTDTLHSYLVSPRISLRSLPADLDPADTGGVPGQPQEKDLRDTEADLPIVQVVNPANPYVDANAIVLTIDHRFHFAEGRDGGTVEIFTKDPRKHGFDDPEASLVPLRSPEDQGSTDAHGSTDAFTGAAGTWKQEAFQLTEWAGEDVWLVFHAATKSTSDLQELFVEDGADRFDDDLQAQGFFGWQVDDIRVEGPAWLHNVRIDDILHPKCDDLGCRAPSGPGQDSPSILVMNRGQVTESVHVTMELDGDPQKCEPDDEVIELVPGQIMEVSFLCPDFVAGQTHEATFRAELTDATPDLFPSDNVKTITIETEQGRAITQAGPLVLNPRLGEENTLRTLQAGVQNVGLSRETVGLELQILRQDPTDPDGGFVDVTADANVVPLLTPNPVVPAFLMDPGDPPQLFEWELVLAKAGNYTLKVVATVEDGDGSQSVVYEQSATAGTLLAPGIAYRALFDGSQEVDDIVAADVPWTTESIQDILPPACMEGPCPDYVWELPRSPVDPRDRGDSLNNGPTSILSGRVSPDALAQEVEYEALVVRVVHQMDIRCPDSNQHCSSSGAFGPATGPGTIELVLDDEYKTTPVVPEEPASVAGAQRVHVLKGVDASPSSNSNIQNLHAFYTGQWFDETFQILPEDVGFSPGPVPAALLAGTTLRFVYDEPREICRGEDSDKGNNFCTRWRVAVAEVVGIGPSGTQSVLLRTAGSDADEVGEWASRKSVLETKEVECIQATDPGGATEEPTNLSPCRRWHKQPVNWAQAPDPLREYLGSELNLDGAWTNSDPNALFRYEDGMRGLLVSPPMTITADMGDPTLQFGHIFSLHQSSEGVTAGDAYRDSVTLMMRIMNGADSTVPATPFMPVAVQYDWAKVFDDTDDDGALDEQIADPQQGIQGDLHAFTQTDCVFYDRATCPPLSQRAPVVEAVPLSRIPILDYLAVPPLDGSFPGSVDRTALRSFAQEGDNARLMDLRSDCEGECTVQFAFRVETVDPILEDMVLAKKSLHAAHEKDDTATEGGEGWFLSEFTILREKAVAHDLVVQEARIEADYDWKALGLGPGTTATLQLDLANDGLFQETNVGVQLDMERLLPDGSTQLELSENVPLQGFVLAPDAQETIEIEFQVPDQVGTYRLMARGYLFGNLAAGLPLVDARPANDCATINQAGASFAQSCDISQAPRLNVHSVPILDMELDATPLAGRADGPRSYGIEIENTGNVPVQGTTLHRIITPFGNGAPKTHSWTLNDALQPGATRQWLALGPSPADHFDEPLGEEGRYLVTAVLDFPGGSVADQIVLDAYQVFFSDSFEPNARTREASTLVSTGEMTASDANWALDVNAPVPGTSQQQGAWEFGKPEVGIYPDGADSILRLPSVDLSTAQSGSVSMYHRYDFEQGFDGGRLEASLDEGGSWFPLEPRGGYPDSLFADSPLNEGGDPTSSILAFSGDTLDVSPETEGWINSEFPLGQISQLTESVQISQLVQEGFDDSILPRPAAPDDRKTYSATWHLPFQSCSGELTGCWYRENLNYRNPEPRSGSQSYWWSRTAQDLTRADVDLSPQQALTTTLPLEINVGQTPAGEGTRLTFWQWKDDAGEANVALDGLDVTGTLQWVDQDDGWNKYSLALTNKLGPHTVNFTYSELHVQSESDHSNRGMVVDQVRLETFTTDFLGADVVLTSTQYGPSHSAWSDPTVGPTKFCDAAPDLCLDDEPQFGWTSTPRVPDVGENWNVRDLETVRGDTRPVWWFGDLTGGFWDYQANAHERLVTPLMSLKGVGGEEAWLTYFEEFDIAGGDERRVLVQELQPTPQGDTFTEWKPLEGSEQASGSRQQSDACPGAVRGWCPREVDISAYIGKEVRFAFEIETTRLNEIPGPGVRGEGFHWGIDEVGIRADSLAGQRVDLRLRAATDGSINEGGWSVAYLQIVGLTYGNNLAILPAEPQTQARVAPGEQVEFTGSVRNLASNVRQGVYLQARIVPEPLPSGEEPPQPDVVLRRDGQPVDTPYIGPVTFGKAGTPSDRFEYSLSVTLPETEGAAYRLQLFLSTDEAGGSPLLDDENLGDHRHENRLVVETESAIDFTANQVTPATVQPGDGVSVEVAADNVGTVQATISPRLIVRDMATGTVVAQQDLPSTPVHAGESSPIEWTWSPAEPGFFAIDASVGLSFASSPTNLTLGHVMVGMEPVFFTDDFGGPVTAVTTRWNSTVDSDCTGTTATVGSGGSVTDCWWLQDAQGDSVQGGRSFHVGPSADDAINNGASYHPRQDTSLESPRIDLEILDDIRNVHGGSSPFDPTLALRYRSLIGCSGPGCDPDDGVIVEASRDNGQNRYWIEGGYTGTVSTGNSFDPQPSCGPCPVLAGNSLVWKLAEFPLGGDILHGATTHFPVVGSDQARFSFRFGSDGNAETRGFSIDGISISAYGVDVAPAKLEPVFTHGSDKTFKFLVTNTGAATDTLQIGIDSANAQYPANGVDVTIDQPLVTLASGQSETVSVDVTVKEGAQIQQSLLRIPLRVTSSQDPLRAASATIDGRFVKEFLPDLSLELKPADGVGGSTVEGDSVTFLSTVTNTRGAANSRPTTLVFMACRDAPQTTLPQDLDSCRQNLKAGSDDGLYVLGEQVVPALVRGTAPSEEPGPRHSLHTVSWVPPLGSRGDYHIVAVADPMQQMRMIGTGSTVDWRPLTVLPIERPDVVVTGLALLDASGEPADEVFSGDVLTLKGRVENRGNADAHNVNIRLLNQFELRRERIPTMVPGQVVDIMTTWKAETGNWIVVLSASTPTPEIDSENNVERIPFAVRSGRVSASFEPEALHRSPGDAATVLLSLHNRRDSEVSLALAGSGAGSVSLAGLPPSITLERGQRVDIPLEVNVSPVAEAGQYFVRVTASSGTAGGAAATATLLVAVDLERDVKVSAAPLVMPPGLGTLEARLANLGTAHEAFDLSLAGPDGWNVTVVNHAVRLEPREARDVEAVVEVPAGTAPGQYHLMASGGPLASQEIPVQITSAASWSTEVLESRSTPTQGQAWVRITNTGNAPGVPELRAEGVAVDPAPRSQLPGEGVVYRIAAIGHQSALQLPGSEPVTLGPSTQRPALEVVGLELSPSRNVGSGDPVRIVTSVRNAGDSVARDVPVRFYVGGVLVEERSIDIAPGQTRDVAAAWTAQSGNTFFAATAGQGDEAIMRAAVLPVDDASRSLPLMGAPWLLAGLCAAAIAARRRRRCT